MPPETFPLVTLQPAHDGHDAWVALLLEGDRPLTGAELARVLRDFGLAETLDLLPCVASVDPAAVDPALAADLPRDAVVLRFPVAVAVDPACGPMLDALRTAGFRLMAAGYPPAGAAPHAVVASLAVPCPGTVLPPEIAAWLTRLPGPHLALGATEKVCPGFCRFHWLGGHLARQATPLQKGDPTTRGLLLKLLALVAADADAAGIEALIKRDPHLSYQLLKLVNSVAFAPGKKIASFAQAIALLGRRQLQRWLQLLLYARAAGSATASPLLPRAALRAALMEALARRAGFAGDALDRAFMAGMLSLLDSLFGEPLERIVAPLNLPDDVVDALGPGRGRLGQLLAAVRAGEGPPGPALAAALAAAGIAHDDWAAALVTAVRWAARVGTEA